MEKVLITGIAGAVGRQLARRMLADYEVCGVDSRGWPNRPERIRIYPVDPRKQGFRDVFRNERPDAVLHLGFGAPGASRKMNLHGVQHLLEHSLRYDVRKLVALSGCAVYGASPDNPFFMDEDHPPAGARDYPEVRDLMEMETLVMGFLWKAMQVRTCLLRPVHVLGPLSHSAMCAYLRFARPPMVLGFDPVFQFLHEEDLATGVMRALELGLSGVYNLAGAGELPLSAAIRAVGGRPLSIPGPLLRAALSGPLRLRMAPWPAAAVDYLKYPVTISGRRFAEATGFTPRFELHEIFQSLRG